MDFDIFEDVYAGVTAKSFPAMDIDIVEDVCAGITAKSFPGMDCDIVEDVCAGVTAKRLRQRRKNGEQTTKVDVDVTNKLPRDVRLKLQAALMRARKATKLLEKCSRMQAAQLQLFAAKNSFSRRCQMTAGKMRTASGRLSRRAFGLVLHIRCKGSKFAKGGKGQRFALSWSAMCDAAFDETHSRNVCGRVYGVSGMTISRAVALVGHVLLESQNSLLSDLVKSFAERRPTWVLADLMWDETSERLGLNAAAFTSNRQQARSRCTQTAGTPCRPVCID